MDLMVAAALIVVLLAFFAWAVWVSYLVVFRGWRIYRQPPPADSSPGNSRPSAGSGSGSPKPSSPAPSNPRRGKEPPPPPRSRRQGRR